MTRSDLTGRSVAVLVADGTEQVEVTAPREALQQAGATVLVLSPDGEDVRGYRYLDPGAVLQVDGRVRDADPGRLDALLLPGGLGGPDTLRKDAAAVDLVRAVAAAGTPLAVICHGPWLMIDADALRGRTLTCVPQLRNDVRNAEPLRRPGRARGPRRRPAGVRAGPRRRGPVRGGGRARGRRSDLRAQPSGRREAAEHPLRADPGQVCGEDVLVRDLAGRAAGIPSTPTADPVDAACQGARGADHVGRAGTVPESPLRRHRISAGSHPANASRSRAFSWPSSPRSFQATGTR